MLVRVTIAMTETAQLQWVERTECASVMLCLVDNGLKTRHSLVLHPNQVHVCGAATSARPKQHKTLPGVYMDDASIPNTAAMATVPAALGLQCSRVAARWHLQYGKHTTPLLVCVSPHLICHMATQSSVPVI